MTDWREQCVELEGLLTKLHELVHADARFLLDEDSGAGVYGVELDISIDESLTRARAELAQPELKSPTDEDLISPTMWMIDDCIYDNDKGEIAQSLRELIARWGRPAIEPVPVAERLPEPGVKVLAHYFNSHGKSRTVCARWIPAKFESRDSEYEDFLEYDEDSDTFYWPEGWYEEIENWDDYQCVTINEGEVTHWQPLPHWALPVPTSQEP